MNILVFGSNGWIGKQFIQLLSGKNINFTLGKSRVNSIDNVSKELDSVNPTHVVSFIGRTHGKINGKVFTTIDYLEEEGKLVENIRDNLFSPIILAELCCKRKIHLFITAAFNTISLFVISLPICLNSTLLPH